VWHRLKAKDHFRRFHENTIDIQIVCAVHLGAVKFRAAYEKVNQPIREAKPDPHTRGSKSAIKF